MLVCNVKNQTLSVLKIFPIIFVVFYTFIMTIWSIVIGWLYNFVVERLNCDVIISIESKADKIG